MMVVGPRGRWLVLRRAARQRDGRRRRQRRLRRQRGAGRRATATGGTPTATASPDKPDFAQDPTLKLHLEPGKSTTVNLEVQNAFGLVTTTDDQRRSAARADVFALRQGKPSMSADTHLRARTSRTTRRCPSGRRSSAPSIAAAAAIAIAARYSDAAAPGRRPPRSSPRSCPRGPRVERARAPRGDGRPARALRRAHVARRGRRGRRAAARRRPVTSSRGSSPSRSSARSPFSSCRGKAHAALRGATLALMAGRCCSRSRCSACRWAAAFTSTRTSSGCRASASTTTWPSTASRSGWSCSRSSSRPSRRTRRSARSRRASRTGASRCCCSKAAMIGTFLALDLFLFYVFWELMLIPMYVMIGVWGGSNRIYSAVKFFLYTFFGSVLMLGAILYVAYAYARVNGGAAELRLLRAPAAAAAASRADLALGRLHAGLRHQGADVPGAHVAAGRAHRGADGGLDHPGGRDAQDGDLRLPALLDGPLPRGVRGVRAPTSRAWPCSAASSTARSAPGSRTT